MIGVIGAGAFGTALAVTLAKKGHEVRLWARNSDHIAEMARTRRNESRLPGISLPETVTVTPNSDDLNGASVILLSLPMQALGAFLAAQGRNLDSPWLVACCKGIDLKTLTGPVELIRLTRPACGAAILTGPSFAADIARGLPTALTLAGGDEALQILLSTPTLRLYRSDDTTGAELGGAMKNVVAIAAGIVIGAGLGDSARAALMTRGYAEMLRLALALGARAETLAGLSGLGDLVLTCTSAQSRNFRFGQALGSGQGFDPLVTVEGLATARAVAAVARQRQIDMPITAMIAALVENQITLPEAIQALMSRPLKQE
ncbi:NAD(P)H-dependent glycerol-3-phosphate dehydrogenase [Fuscibacter oryzae]|uniref:Glycerol-3-phosphate dehydrogenase [NAD(P)+] n=1 Tax=Fuscibacter oryzae TaxID=2803939 RepID=A0A8J7MSV8_9RHOB|nr:NAD(P)H-dependent glycerol-3-phosphate dehydrogenase [Fuscibacter oryzae]MBL4929032.1 NAD(P)-dependent glycerol-3-phosphate dehydrogenase [Fuscibacter oryzae]